MSSAFVKNVVVLALIVCLTLENWYQTRSQPKIPQAAGPQQIISFLRDNMVEQKRFFQNTLGQENPNRQYFEPFSFRDPLDVFKSQPQNLYDIPNQYNQYTFPIDSPLPFQNLREDFYPSDSDIYSYGPGYKRSSILELGKIQRSIDGSNHNLRYRDLGKFNASLIRLAPANYQDSRSIPIRSVPDVRIISNSIGNQNYGIFPDNVSMAFTTFGQFIDHDLDLTSAGNKESMPIKIPQNDQFFKKTKEIKFNRSKFIPELSQEVRTFPNEATGWIDGSQVYGHEESVAKKLRQFKNGKIKTTDNGNLLHKEKDLFVAGDKRSNQNILLTIFHTVFVKQHNRLCDEILKMYPGLSDEEVYQSARNYVVGLIQKITIQEYLPVLLGPSYFRLVGPYRGYNQNIDPTLSIQFTTAIFRFGHSQLVNNFFEFDEKGRVVDMLELKNLFFNPSLLNKKRIQGLTRGLSKVPSKQRSNVLVDDIRNFLIENSTSRDVFFDLFSLNVQRGRDHGLPFYNELRKEFSLKPFRSFREFTNNPQLAYQLERIYGHPDRMELWVGIISEPKIEGAVLGQLGTFVAAQTFRKLRDGDRLWYENIYPEDIIEQIKNTKLSDIIKRNIEGTQYIQPDVFIIE